MRYLYYICILFFILRGCACWIARDYDPLIYTCISVITIICWYLNYKTKRSGFTNSFLCMFIGLCIVNLIFSRFNIFALIDYATNAFAISTPFLIQKTEQKKLLCVIDSFFSVSILIVIAFHLLAIYNMLPLISSSIRGGLKFYNYYFYLGNGENIYRCCGFCYEPGFFSLLLSALLLVNKYNIKKYSTYIYLVALIMTLSLGGFLLTIVCWYLYYSLNNTNNIKVFLKRNILFFSLFVGLLLYVMVFWNQGNNIVNEMILSRLEYNETTGVSGNNRQDLNAQIEWYDFLQSDSKLLGYGVKKYYEKRSSSLTEYNAASIAEFVMQVGFVGTLIFVLSIAYYLFHKNDKKYALTGSIFLLLDFIQHGYNIDTSMYILVVLWVIYYSNLDNANMRIGPYKLRNNMVFMKEPLKTL